MQRTKYYFTYIITNRHKTVLYIGVTNSLKRRLTEHTSASIPDFSSRYKCKHLVYYEKFNDIGLAISREKEMKKWGKRKKVALISKSNPHWEFLNERIYRTDDEYL